MAEMPAPHLQRPLTLEQGELTQTFGANPADYARFGLAGHNGLDYGCVVGTPLAAPCDGVLSHGDDGTDGFGLYVKITNTDGGYYTLLGHLSQILVPDGQAVVKGQIVAQSGNTGNSTGPHVHLGLKFLNGSNPAYQGAVDPTPFRW